MTEPYAAKALESELDRVRAAVEGTRNDTLHLAAFRIGQLVADGRLPAVDAERALVDAGLATGLGRREAAATVRSGLRGGVGRPRDGAQPADGSPLAGLAGLAPVVGGRGLDYEDRLRLLDQKLGLAPTTGGRAAQEVPERPEQEAEPTWDERIAAAAIDAQALDTIPVPEPLIPGVLMRDSIAWLFGPPASCKSFIALDMAGCVGTGANWQGFGKPEPGPVLYVVAEGASGLRARVRAWEGAMGAPMRNVRFLPMPVQVTDAAAWAALVRYAVAMGAVLVVLDTQARISVGLEENSAKEMGMFVARVERLRAATRACVMPVHHTGRNGEHMRGSIALDGAADTLIKVSRSEEIILVECAKQKDAAEFSQLRLRAVPFEGSIIVSETIGGPTSTLDSPNVGRLLQAWWSHCETDWVTPKLLADLSGLPRVTLWRATKDLVKAGMAEVRGEGPARRVRLSRQPPGATIPDHSKPFHETQASTRPIVSSFHPPFRGETNETVGRASAPKRRNETVGDGQPGGDQ